MKQYKTAKKVKIRYKEVTRYVSEYDCPFCGTLYIGASIGQHVTRFKCLQCNNPLIVDKE